MISGSINYKQVTSTYHYAGSKSLELLSPYDVYNAIAYRPLQLGNAQQITLEVAVRTPGPCGTNGATASVGLFNPALGSGGRGFGRVYFGQGQIYASRKYTDSSLDVSLGSYTSGQWYLVRIEANFGTRTFDVYIDGTQKANSLAILDDGMPSGIFLGNNKGICYYYGGTYDPVSQFDEVKVETSSVSTLSVTLDPANGGGVMATGITCGFGYADCTEAVGTGAVVSLTAQPNPYQVFDHWEVESTNYTQNPLSLTMDADKVVTAVFVPGNQTNLFYDGFENYPINTLPTTGDPGGWQMILSGRLGYQKVTNAYASAGSKSLQLEGYGTRDSVIYRPVTFGDSNRVTFEVAMRVNSYTNPPGHHGGYIDLFNPSLGSGGIGFGRILFSGTGTSGQFNAARKHGDSTQNVLLGTYTVGQWNVIRIVADFDYRVFDVFINGTIKARNLAIMDDGMPTGVSLCATKGVYSYGGGNYYHINQFDEVKVISPTTANLVVIPEPANEGVVNGSGIACGNGNTDCEEMMYWGDHITLQATPSSESYRFGYWQRDGVMIGNENPKTFTITDATSVKAVFFPIPAYFGLFFGVRDDETPGYSTLMRGDLSATNASNAYASYCPFVVHNKLVTGDASENGTGITKEEIQVEFNEMKMFADQGIIQSGDTLLVYFATHGSSENNGNETTIDPGDEYLTIGHDSLGNAVRYTDNELRFALQEIDDLTQGEVKITKIVVLDACYSGGFWGNSNPDDTGDLEKLSNIALIAAAREGQEGGYYDATSYYQPGTGFLAHALEEAFKRDEFGYCAADTNQDNILTTDELGLWAQQFPTLDDLLCLATPHPSGECPPYPGEIIFMSK